MSDVAHAPAASAGPAETAGGRRSGLPLLPVLIFAAFALAPLAGRFGFESYVYSLVTRAMIFGIAALSLNLILGFGGLVSFGHAAFLGIGAYAAGILTSHGIEGALPQLAATLAVSALFALVTGAISLRTRGVYFIMITLAFGQMLFFLARSLAPYGGDDGLTLPAKSLVFGTGVLERDAVFYYAVLAILAACYLLTRSLIASRFGRVLRGARDNAVRMQALGYDPYRFQLVAYVIAGMMAGVAGFLLANQAEFVSPAYMTWQRSGELIVMVILGGIGSLSGAILGAAAFLFLEEALAAFYEHWRLLLGPILILVVLFARGGLTGFLGRGRHE